MLRYVNANLYLGLAAVRPDSRKDGEFAEIPKWLRELFAKQPGRNSRTGSNPTLSAIIDEKEVNIFYG